MFYVSLRVRNGFHKYLFFSFLLLFIFIIQLSTIFAGEALLSGSIPNDGNYYNVNFNVAAGEIFTVLKVALDIDADPMNEPDFYISTAACVAIGQLNDPNNFVTLEKGPGAEDDLADVEWYCASTALDPCAGDKIIEIRIDHRVRPSGSVDSNEVWTLQIKNNDTAAREFFIGVGHFTTSDTGTPEAGAISDAEIPYIKVNTSSIDFGEVLAGGEAPANINLVISNIGTKTLSLITNIPVPSHAAFDLPVISVPHAIDSVSSLLTQISFDPTHSSIISAAPGPINANIVFTNNSDNNQTLTVNLQATAIKLEFVMLYDISGSMALTPGGIETSNPGEQRLGQAKEAGLQLLSLFQYMEGDAIRTGLVTFPRQGDKCDDDGATAFTRIPGPGSTANVNLDTLTFTGSQFSSAFGTGSDSLQTTYGIGILTPLAEGLKVAHGTGASNFGTTRWTDNEYAHRAILLLTDGAHNCHSTAYPSTTTEWIFYLTSTVIPDSRKIKIFTIPYGNPGSPHVDQDNLDDLSNASGGGMYFADVTNYVDLKDQFRKALVEWRSDWNIIDDPEDSLVAGETIKSHDVCIDDDAYRIAFIVDWNKMSANTLNFELQGPGGIVNVASPDVSFQAGQNYAMYIVKGDTAKGPAGSDNWTLKFSGGTGSRSGETINYTYSVISKTRVTMNTSMAAQSIHTSQAQLLEIQINGINAIAKNASVLCEYNIPGESMGTYLSSMKNLNPAWLNPLMYQTVKNMKVSEVVAPYEIMGEKASLLQRKIYALENFAEFPFKNQRTTGRIKLNDEGLDGDKAAGDGIYSAMLPNVQFDGLANFGVFFTVNEEDCVKRELWIDKYVHVDLRSAILGKQIKFLDVDLPIFAPPEIRKITSVNPPRGYLRRSVVFTPQDEFGNYWGPGHADRINYKVKNAEPLGPIVDNLDGSYSQVIEYRTGMVPSAIVTARGVSSPEVKMEPPDQPVPLGISAHLGYSILNGSLNNYNGVSGILDVGYTFPLNMSAEVFLGFHYFPEDDTGNSTYWINTSLNGRFTYPVFGWFNLFVHGGGGWYKDAAVSAAGWNAGGGITAELNKNWHAELGYNYHNILGNNSAVFSVIQLGLWYIF